MLYYHGVEPSPLVALPIVHVNMQELDNAYDRDLLVNVPMAKVFNSQVDPFLCQGPETFGFFG